MVGGCGLLRQISGKHASIQCPYCEEPIDLFIDDTVDRQQYVENCPVCCRPIDVSVMTGDDGEMAVAARAENDA